MPDALGIGEAIASLQENLELARIELEFLRGRIAQLEKERDEALKHNFEANERLAALMEKAKYWGA